MYFSTCSGGTSASSAPSSASATSPRLSEGRLSATNRGLPPKATQIAWLAGNTIQKTAPASSGIHITRARNLNRGGPFPESSAIGYSLARPPVRIHRQDHLQSWIACLILCARPFALIFKRPEKRLPDDARSLA